MQADPTEKTHPAYALWEKIPAGSFFKIALKDGEIPGVETVLLELTKIKIDTSPPPLRSLPRGFSVFLESETFIGGLSHRVEFTRMDNGETFSAFLNSNGPVDSVHLEKMEPVCQYQILYN